MFGLEKKLKAYIDQKYNARQEAYDMRLGMQQENIEKAVNAYAKEQTEKLAKMSIEQSAMVARQEKHYAIVEGYLDGFNKLIK